jgi:peptide-methionine (R)-S-oxide reductase
MNRQISRRTALASASLFFAAGASAARAAKRKPGDAFANAPERGFTNQQWQAKLSPSAYAVLRHEDTEHPFSSLLNDELRIPGQFGHQFQHQFGRGFRFEFGHRFRHGVGR